MEKSVSELALVFLFPLLIFWFVFGLFNFFFLGEKIDCGRFQSSRYISKEKYMSTYLHVTILSLQTYGCLTPFGMYFHMYSMSDQKNRLSVVLRLCIINEIVESYGKMPQYCPNSLLSQPYSTWGTWNKKKNQNQTKIHKQEHQNNNKKFPGSYSSLFF